MQSLVIFLACLFVAGGGSAFLLHQMKLITSNQLLFWSISILVVGLAAIMGFTFLRPMS